MKNYFRFAAFLVIGLALLLPLPVVAQVPLPPRYADKANLLVVSEAGTLSPVRTKDDWQKRRHHIIENMEVVMGPMPKERKRTFDYKVVAVENLEKVVRKSIRFAVGEDDMLPAYLLIPKNLTGKAPAMLCLHQTTAIGKGEPAGVGGLPNLRYALELAERGYITLAPDYPNFGGYKIDVYAKGFISATMKGIWNHRKCVDFLQTLDEVDPDRIGVIGHSLGGHNSLFVAAFDERLKVAVTSCGFNSFPKYFKGNLTGWSHKGYMPRIASMFDRKAEKMPFDFPEVLAAIAPRAVFINAPLNDSNFEVTGVKDCVKAAAPVFNLLGAKDQLTAEYPEAGHDFPPAIRQRAYEFIDQRLGKK